MSRTIRTIACLGAACFVLLQVRSGAAPVHSPWSAPVMMESPLNSASFENLPALSRDGLSLHFSSNRPFLGGGGNHDLFVAQRADDNAPWEEPVNLGSVLNTPDYLESGAALSRDGHWLFFHSNRPGGMGGNDLWVSWRRQTRDDFGWEAPVNLGDAVNSAADDMGCTFFEGDGEAPAELYFTSNRGGGLGAADIYVSRLEQDGTFGPAALVVELISPLGDSRPQISHDGLEIYIQSNRSGSIGGSPDIWVATRPHLYAAWDAPTNVTEVNTRYDEFQHGLSPDGLTLIIESIRPDGYGGADFYIATRTKGNKGRR